MGGVQHSYDVSNALSSPGHSRHTRTHSAHTPRQFRDSVVSHTPPLLFCKVDGDYNSPDEDSSDEEEVPSSLAPY
jgi:hypothetical protein